jgi:hypothetical protein
MNMKYILFKANLLVWQLVVFHKIWPNTFNSQTAGRENVISLIN